MHFCVSATRGGVHNGFCWPRKIGTNWFIPRLVPIRLNSWLILGWRAFQMEICAHSLHLAARTYEPHSRRPTADAAQLALRHKGIRSGPENLTRRLNRA